jgi:putative addiction module CopG family antidote
MNRRYYGVEESMTIRLKPEIEALIERDVQRGSYQSSDDFVEEAVRQLHDQEEWLAENRARITADIEDGYASAQRGELLTPDEVRSHLERKKRIWTDQQRQA